MNAIPGGPFDGEKAISDEVRRVLEQRFNLDKPVWEQFFLDVYKRQELSMAPAIL